MHNDNNIRLPTPDEAGDEFLDCEIELNKFEENLEENEPELFERIAIYRKKLKLYTEEKRLVAVKSDQIGSISFAAALLSGFGSTILAQVIIPSPGIVNDYILLFFGLLTTVEIGLSLLSLIISTMVLISILNFDCHLAMKKENSFETFWANRCASEWMQAYTYFNWSIYTFLLDLVFVALVQFQVVIYTTYFVAAVVFLTVCVILCWILPRWSSSVAYTTERRRDSL